MKKIILMFLMVFTITMASAQTYYYTATSFACKVTNSYGNWSDWSDWQSCNILVTINFTNDVVTIYSNKTQVYNITQYVRNYIDSSGGNQLEFKFIDQDYDRGTMRLRIEKNGNSQMYIDFANAMWVYNVRKRY